MRKMPQNSKAGKGIADSAFLVNESRARNVHLSRDIFAKLWVSESTRALWEEFNQTVYPHDAIELGVRNRFFLERLRLSTQQDGVTTFLNMAAGFTNYPFLIDFPLRFIEVDFPHVIAFKRERTKRWEAERLLPKRKIEFVGLDLNDSANIGRLKSRLEPSLSGSPSFALFEGITYYLSKTALRTLFEMISRLQAPNSSLVFDYWLPEVESHPVCIRFRKFLLERLGHKKATYNYLDHDFISKIPGYKWVENTDVVAQEAIYSDQPVLAKEESIFDSYAVLKKAS